MPRKTKEETIEVTDKNVKPKTSSKKTTSKKVASKTTTKQTAKKETVKKTPNKTPKKVETKKTSKDNKASTTKKTTKKSTTTKKVSSKTKKTNESKKKVEIVEYYDLPYRYNQTVVKLLAQTPNTLFVYWDISDEDKENYIKQYGEYFFSNTKPVLVIHNKTKNYSFEIDINDFANSWYLNVTDANCNYQIELGRRPINEYVNISNNYLYITNSNDIQMPNDRILFDSLSHFVYFKNVKTNETIKKHINLTLLNKIGKTTSVQEFYKKLYKQDDINFDRLSLDNPSSNNPTSCFK